MNKLELKPHLVLFNVISNSSGLHGLSIYPGPFNNRKNTAVCLMLWVCSMDPTGVCTNNLNNGSFVYKLSSCPSPLSATAYCLLPNDHQAGANH